MTKIYNSPNDTWQVCVDDRLQGWGVQVSYWNGEDFDTRFDSYMISENLREAITDAMTGAGIDWETASNFADDWGILYPDEDDETEQY